MYQWHCGGSSVRWCCKSFNIGLVCVWFGGGLKDMGPCSVLDSIKLYL